MNAMGHPTKFKADRKAVTCFGEVMAELADLGAEQVRVGVGGDTFNTAVYLARLGTPVRYATALGQDPFSERIRKRMALEGVDAELVATSSDRNCGLYAIEVDETGERASPIGARTARRASSSILPGPDRRWMRWQRPMCCTSPA